LMISDATNSEGIEEWDSMNHINLVLSIEKTLNIRFLTGEIQSLKNVGEMIDLLVEKIKS
jgi:acyl carrier protein